MSLTRKMRPRGGKFPISHGEKFDWGRAQKSNRAEGPQKIEMEMETAAALVPSSLVNNVDTTPSIVEPQLDDQQTHGADVHDLISETFEKELRLSDEDSGVCASNDGNEEPRQGAGKKRTVDDLEDDSVAAAALSTSGRQGPICTANFLGSHSLDSACNDAENLSLLKHARLGDDVGTDAGDNAVLEPQIDHQQAPAPLQINIGDILEAEMMDSNYPKYTDTIHRVYVLGNDSGEYRCKLLAFGTDDVDHWPGPLLHKVRDADVDNQWQPDDHVHVRIRDREDDGDERVPGVWVKATIVRQEPDGQYCARHVNWDDLNTTMEETFAIGDIRRAW